MTTKIWEGDSVTISIDYDKCTGSGECATICPTNVYEIIEQKSVVINVDACIECCACVENCPTAAITHSSC